MKLCTDCKYNHVDKYDDNWCRLNPQEIKTPEGYWCGKLQEKATKVKYELSRDEHGFEHYRLVKDRV